MKYWIGVVSREHVLTGISEGIAQLGHGKRAPLARLKKGDWLIYYSPTESLGDKTPVQAFTALSEVADDDIYEFPGSGDFIQYRRRMIYKKVTNAPIRPMIEELSFIKSKKSWGYIFRLGLIEIPEEDFNIIKNKLLDHK
jgi:predicted RNA-binding protein